MIVCVFSPSSETEEKKTRIRSISECPTPPPGYRTPSPLNQTPSCEKIRPEPGPGPDGLGELAGLGGHLSGELPGGEEDEHDGADGHLDVFGPAGPRVGGVEGGTPTACPGTPPPSPTPIGGKSKHQYKMPPQTSQCYDNRITSEGLNTPRQDHHAHHTHTHPTERRGEGGCGVSGIAIRPRPPSASGRYLD